MFDKRLLAVLGCAVIFGLIAAVMVSRYLAGVQARNHAVVVARVNIPLSSQITAEQLTTVQIPRDATPEGAFLTPDKLVGRVVMTSVSAREPITESKLAPEGSEAGLTAMIAEGSRAMTVKVDDVVGVAGFVTPGSWVDVVVVIKPNENIIGGAGPTSKIVLQHIKVLASNQRIEKQENGEGVPGLRAVTLEVTPEQAEKLALAATEGRLQLVMRNAIDKEAVVTDGENKQTLLSGATMGSLPAAGSPAMQAARAGAGRGAGGLGTNRARASTGAPGGASGSPGASMESGIEKRGLIPTRVVEVFEAGKRRLIEFP